MKIKTRTVIALTFVIGIVGIFSSMALGFWYGEDSEKTPARFVGTDFDGEYRADDIRGSYTFGDISRLYNIPLESLAYAFHVSPDKAESFSMKNLDTIFADEGFEIGTGSVKMFVAFYLGQPYDLGDSTTYITQEGAETIKTHGKPTNEQLSYLSTHILGMEENPSDAIAESPEPTKTTEPYVTVSVSGSDYFKDIAKTYDIPLEDLAEAFLVSSQRSPFYQVKDLKSDFNQNETEIGTNSVKMFIAFYKGLNIDISNASSAQTFKGVEILKSKGKPTDEQLLYLESHTFTE